MNRGLFIGAALAGGSAATAMVMMMMHSSAEMPASKTIHEMAIVEKMRNDLLSKKEEITRLQTQLDVLSANQERRIAQEAVRQARMMSEKRFSEGEAQGFKFGLLHAQAHGWIDETGRIYKAQWNKFANGSPGRAAP